MYCVSMLVVPYVGTWIEMLIRYIIWICSSVVPYVGTWIEMMSSWYTGIMSYRRSLRGNVDRNATQRLYEKDARVVPYVGTWIEMQRR